MRLQADLMWWGEQCGWAHLSKRLANPNLECPYLWPGWKHCISWPCWLFCHQRQACEMPRSRITLRRRRIVRLSGPILSGIRVDLFCIWSDTVSPGVSIYTEQRHFIARNFSQSLLFGVEILWSRMVSSCMENVFLGESSTVAARSVQHFFHAWCMLFMRKSRDDGNRWFT